MECIVAIAPSVRAHSIITKRILDNCSNLETGFSFRKGSVQVEFKIIIVLVTNDPENATDLPDVKAKTAQRVVVKAKTGFVETLQVKKVIVKSKCYLQLYNNPRYSRILIGSHL